MGYSIATSNLPIIILVIIVIIAFFSIIPIAALYALGFFNPQSYEMHTERDFRCDEFESFHLIDIDATSPELILHLRNGDKRRKIVKINMNQKIDDSPVVLGKDQGEWIEPGSVFTVKADEISLEPGYYEAGFILITYSNQNDDLNRSDWVSCNGNIK